MKNHIRLIALALCFGTFVLLAPASSAQNKGAKLPAISQQLNLTPQQKAKVLPILADEAPKVEAIKNNSSLSGFQKNATAQGYSSADRSSNESDSFARPVPKATGDSPTGDPRGNAETTRPLTD